MRRAPQSWSTRRLLGNRRDHMSDAISYPLLDAVRAEEVVQIALVRRIAVRRRLLDPGLVPVGSIELGEHVVDDVDDVGGIGPGGDGLEQALAVLQPPGRRRTRLVRAHQLAQARVVLILEALEVSVLEAAPGDLAGLFGVRRKVIE